MLRQERKNAVCIYPASAFLYSLSSCGWYSRSLASPLHRGFANNHQAAPRTLFPFLSLFLSVSTSLYSGGIVLPGTTDFFRVRTATRLQHEAPLKRFFFFSGRRSRHCPVGGAVPQYCN